MNAARLLTSAALLKLKTWEKALALFSVILFLISFYWYLTDFPLKNYLWTGLEDEESQSYVGQIFKKEGQVRRLKAGELEFKNVDQGNDLFNKDTLVTHEGSQATFLLQDGSQIELGANAMVRLSFVPEASITGIQRIAKVDVVSGQVTGRARKKKIVVRFGTKEVAITKNQAKIVKAPPPPTPAPKPLSPNAVAPPIEQELVVIETAPLPIEEVLPLPSPSPALTVNPSPAPSPSPSPSVQPITKIKSLTVLSPKDSSTLKIPPQSSIAEMPVTFRWKQIPNLVHLKLNLKGPQPSFFKEEIIIPTQKEAALILPLNFPGLYRWELTPAEPLTEFAPGIKNQFEFTIAPEFQGIEVLEPLITGEKRATNQIRNRVLKKFEALLRWSPFPDVKEYAIRFYKSEEATEPNSEKTTNKTEYLLLKEKIFSGMVYYEIHAQTSTGFHVFSKRSTFVFNFLPPALTSPANHYSFSIRQSTSGEELLLTWQKTNFTQEYEIEIANNSQMKKPLIQETQEDNFYLFTAPKHKTQQYWWRVKSLGKGYSSSFSEIRTFTVNP